MLLLLSRRDAEVLKDRDLSGELKDIWGAVQAKREREKEPNYGNYPQNDIYIEFGPETSQDRRGGPPPPHDFNNHQKTTPTTAATAPSTAANQHDDNNLHHLADTALNLYDHATSPPPPPPPSYDAIQHDKIQDMATVQLIENAIQQQQHVPNGPPPAFPTAIEPHCPALSADAKDVTDAIPTAPNAVTANDAPSSNNNVNTNANSNNRLAQQPVGQTPAAVSVSLDGNGKPTNENHDATPNHKQQNSSSASIPARPTPSDTGWYHCNWVVIRNKIFKKKHI